MKRIILVSIVFLLLSVIGFLTWLYFFSSKNLGVSYVASNITDKEDFSCTGILTTRVDGDRDFIFGSMYKDPASKAEVQLTDDGKRLSLEMTSESGARWKGDGSILENESGRIVVNDLGNSGIYTGARFWLDKETGLGVWQGYFYPLKDEETAVAMIKYFSCK